jgi:hypothetical protein
MPKITDQNGNLKVTQGFSGQVLSGYISSGQVGQFALSSGSVTSGAIASGSVGHFALSSGSVGSGNIASGSVGSFALASGSVGSYSQAIFYNSGGLFLGLVANGTISGITGIAIQSGNQAIAAGSGKVAIGVNANNALSGANVSIISDGIMIATTSGMPLTISGITPGSMIYINMGSTQPGIITWNSGGLTTHGTLSTVFSGNILCQPIGTSISSGILFIQTGVQAMYVSGILP